jgi:SAM-dependent methyltransferase
MSDDTTDATGEPAEPSETEATAFWEGRYRERDQIWSGRPNRALVDVIGSADIAPGRALDLGSGEGADSIWLAEQGWQVTGVDISATALGRAAAHSSDRGIAGDTISWVHADLAEWSAERESFDLVSACFLHSPVAFPREEVLRRAAGAVAPGGYLLVVGHAAFPPWSATHHGDADAGADADRAPAGHGEGHGTEGGGHSHDHDDLPTPAHVLESLSLPEGTWETVIAENRSREATGPDGQTAVLDDAILLIRRRA